MGDSTLLGALATPIIVGLIGSLLVEPLLYHYAPRGGVERKLRRAVMAAALFMGLAVAPAVVLLLALAGSLGLGGLLLVAIFFLAQYMLAPLIFTSGAVPAVDAGHAWLQEAADRLARESGVRGVRVYVAPSEVPNAYAVSSPLRRAIVINRGLLGLLTEREMEAVIGHELGHIKHRDNAYLIGVSFAPTLLHWLGIAITIIGVSMIYGALHAAGRTEEEQAVSLSFGLLGLGLAAIGMLVVMTMILIYVPIRAFTRLREHLADIHSARLTRDESLISALEKIEAAISAVKEGSGNSLSVPSLRNMLYIAPAIEDALFRTHPTLEQRALIVRAFLKDYIPKRQGY